jgi:four helix bundle protein
MKRAAVSVASNIAEGPARPHVGEFRQFLAMPNGSLAELDTQRIIAEELHLINQARMLNSTTPSLKFEKCFMA